MSTAINKLINLHDRFFALVSLLQSPFLLLVRVYWGWQLIESGWGKLHNLGKVTEFFTSLNLPMPAQMAVFISCVEFFGGLFSPSVFFSHDRCGPHHQHDHGLRNRRSRSSLLNHFRPR
jgi:hypothetical protein